MGEQEALMRINIPVECGCGEKFTVQVNAWNPSDFKIVKQPVAGWAECKKIVERYKQIKGFDRFATWDGKYLKRAVKEVKGLLRFLRKLEDPVGVALEMLDDTAAQAKEQGWSWNLATLEKRAPEWLLAKAKAAELAAQGRRA